MPNKPKTMRNSSKFTFNVGYVLVFFALFMICFALFTRTLITPDNFVMILFTILGAGTSFFGINVARVTTENVKAMKNTADVSMSTPEPDETSMITPVGTLTIDQSKEVTK